MPVKTVSVFILDSIKVLFYRSLLHPLGLTPWRLFRLYKSGGYVSKKGGGVQRKKKGQKIGPPMVRGEGDVHRDGEKPVLFVSGFSPLRKRRREAGPYFFPIRSSIFLSWQSGV